MPFITTPDGVQIRYQEFGSGRPLVLAHGFSASLDMWWPQVDALSQGHRLIVWDARGHGASSAPRDRAAYSMPGMAADLRCLLEGIDAVEDAVIGGMSFGGQIALQYTVDHPADVRALILSDSTTRGDTPPRGEVPLMFQDDYGLEGAFLAMDSRPDLTSQLGALQMPALILYGEYDPMIAAGIDRVASGLPNRRLVLMRYCSHGTSGQRPMEWADAVLRFLDDVDAGIDVRGEEAV
ncbi:MAG: alpha/beta fold hydrolase [Dehalococcoidia bacterium]